MTWLDPNKVWRIYKEKNTHMAKKEVSREADILSNPSLSLTHLKEVVFICQHSCESHKAAKSDC